MNSPGRSEDAFDDAAVFSLPGVPPFPERRRARPAPAPAAGAGPAQDPGRDPDRGSVGAVESGQRFRQGQLGRPRRPVGQSPTVSAPHLGRTRRSVGARHGRDPIQDGPRHISSRASLAMAF